jgi:hypothetical protein
MQDQLSLDVEAVPYGYCHCRCGGRTNVSPYSHKGRGLVRGEPRKYINGHQGKCPGPEYAIEDRGYETPCWVWQRKRIPSGYGYLNFDGRQWVAHVLYWERVNGPVPDGYELDHLCRVRPCVRPDHLEVVTHALNVQRSMTARLTPEAVAIIRATPRIRGSGRALAERFGVGPTAISDIRNGKTWK